MSFKSILFAGSAFASLIAFTAPAAAAPYYRCGYDWCYDDQYEETRELNLMQLDRPGAGVYAVPGYHGPGYDDDDDDYRDRSRWDRRYGDDDHDRGWGRYDDDDDAYDAPYGGYGDYDDDDDGDDDD